MDGKRGGVILFCGCVLVGYPRPGPARLDPTANRPRRRIILISPYSFFSSCSPPLQLKSIDTQPTALEEEEEKTQKFLTFLFSWNYHSRDIYEGARHHHDDGDDPTDDCIYTH